MVTTLGTRRTGFVEGEGAGSVNGEVVDNVAVEELRKQRREKVVKE